MKSPVRMSRRQSWEASVKSEPYSRLEADWHQQARDVSPPREDESDSDSGDEDQDPNQVQGKGTWTRDEHKRFLEAIKIYVNGPWKLVAEYVGTRTVRQTMTHAQKYRQKAARRIRGLRTKQAIMRMHCGHEVSEESMAQERMRSMLGQSRHAYLPPELCTSFLQSAGPISPCTSDTPSFSMMDEYARLSTHSSTSPSPSYDASFDAAVGNVLEDVLDIKVKPTPFDMQPPLRISTSYSNELNGYVSDSNASDASDCSSVLAPLHNFGELEISTDLSNSPTLEECANVLLDVLFDETSTV
ncbi:hypothetical protein Poli38472_008347 [Pythium oligandrum]|uniref:Uncharacterized protein n=1 Tax=Pythium oligandrum TaxID=41045 RepID=A0A8K1CN85_PYTOL|nr:hypothetical protein Poli38472_008347 [Pythium oligandrum]|eukprot:TMW65705.1 hypothetical protein Poli38472_008347 [Pythium oligandrum]